MRAMQYRLLTFLGAIFAAFLSLHAVAATANPEPPVMRLGDAVRPLA
jgi:HAMP domain-containing protein